MDPELLIFYQTDQSSPEASDSSFVIALNTAETYEEIKKILDDNCQYYIDKGGDKEDFIGHSKHLIKDERSREPIFALSQSLKTALKILKDNKVKGEKPFEELPHKLAILLTDDLLSNPDLLKANVTGRAMIISRLLCKNERNTEDYFRYMGRSSEKNPETEANLERLIQLYKECKLPELSKKGEERLKKLRSKKQ